MDVVVGAKNPHKKAIAESCRNLPGVRLHCQTGKMAEPYGSGGPVRRSGRDGDLGAVVPGIPTVTVAVAVNQEGGPWRHWRQQRNFWYLGRSSETTPRRLCGGFREDNQRQLETGIALTGKEKNCGTKS